MQEEGQGQGVILGAGAELEAVRSSNPIVYVPRRFRIGGIEGIRTGAAIVGTPQGNGMVAIDVEAKPDVEPNPELWSSWIAEAAERHFSEAKDRSDSERSRTRLVSEAALVECGHFTQGQVVIDDTGAGAAISRWIQAGRADFVVEVPFPHEI
jgi:hypothetical protein